MRLFANFVSSLKTACLNKVITFVAKKNKKIINLCLILEELGYISGFTILNKNYIKVNLRYYRNKSVIRTLNLFSKPSSRVYLKKKNIYGYQINSFIKNNSFTLFYSSSCPQLLTDVELIMNGAGGEPIIVVG